MTKILIFYQWFWRNPDDFDEPVKIPLLLILDSSKFSIQKLTPFPNSVPPSRSTYCFPLPSRFLLPLSFSNRPCLLFLSLQHAEVIFAVVKPTIPPQWHNHQRDLSTPLKEEGSHWSISVFRSAYLRHEHRYRLDLDFSFGDLALLQYLRFENFDYMLLVLQHHVSIFQIWNFRILK